MKPEAAGWRVIGGSGAWTVRFEPDRETVVFGQALEGDFGIVRDDGLTLRTSPGDFILMAQPPPWEMRAFDGGAPVDSKAATADPSLWRLLNGEGPSARFTGGFFKLAPAGAELLSQLMPPVIVVRNEEARGSRLGVLLDLLRQEAEEPRSGGADVIKRLLEVLLVEVLRSPTIKSRVGLLAGLADARINQALRLMHNGADRTWTVGEIAREIGMSRAAFASRFAEVIGAPPMEYLAGWRMTLAKQALLAGDVPMPTIADIAGYRSVSAFSTAFRRRVGAPPTAYRRSTLATS